MGYHHRHASAVLVRTGDDTFAWFMNAAGREWPRSIAEKKWPRGVQIADMAASTPPRHDECIYCRHASARHAALPQYQTREEAINAEGELGEEHFDALGL